MDANHSGDIEFEELATMLRAFNPQMPRPKHIEDVDLEPHPLLEQVQAMLECNVMSPLLLTPQQIQDRAR